jgi:hypothetical protein
MRFTLIRMGNTFAQNFLGPDLDDNAISVVNFKIITFDYAL